ncbi:MAG TPA: FHA domain-containing protein, partial [Roseimicrobium sp.]|nr:FHA domain-containing protein [Roseimicrobium sp.]
VDLRLRDVHQHLVGRRPLRINASTAMDAPAPNLRDIYTNLDAFEAESGLGDSSFAKIAGNMTFRSMSELATYRLPDRPQMFPLQEEWHLNQAVMATLGVGQSKKLIIPKPFRRYSQPGTLLRLTPKSEGSIKPVHFIASPEFTIGRSRKRATLVTWFYPLTPHNEDKTQHLSKVHVVARHENGGVFLTDAGSRCGTTLDAGPMTPFEPVSLKARTFLGLADEYFLDVHPIETSCPGGPEIVNISLWNGPDSPPSDLSGAITFKPLDMEVALNEAVWLFTDANFGKSTRNPWTLNIEGVELVQGRIHHYRGCFWLESLASNFAIHVNSHPVGAREIVPLMDGLDLKIGSVSFQVDVILEEPPVGTIDS